MLFIRRGWWNWDMVSKEWVLLNEVDSLPMHNRLEASERIGQLVKSYDDHDYPIVWDNATDTHHVYLSHTFKTTFELHGAVEYPRTLMQYAEHQRWNYAEVDGLREVLGDRPIKDFVRWMSSAFRHEMRTIDDYILRCAR